MTLRGCAVFVALCVGLPCWADDRESQQVSAGEGAELRVLKSLPRQWAGSSTTTARLTKTRTSIGCHRPSPPRPQRFCARSLICTAIAHHVGAQNGGGASVRCATAREAPAPAAADRHKKGRRYVSEAPPDISRALRSTSGRGWEQRGVCLLHEFAQLNPQFGVHFWLGRAVDRPHMEPTTRKPMLMRLASAWFCCSARLRPLHQNAHDGWTSR